MPFVLIAVGVAALWLDYLGTTNLAAAGTLLKQEMFTNQTPFYKWAGAIIIVGLLGYIPEMRPISTAMLVLIILSVALSHAGPVTNLEKAL